jgi:hypothetical protein
MFQTIWRRVAGAVATVSVVFLLAGCPWDGKKPAAAPSGGPVANAAPASASPAPAVTNPPTKPPAQAGADLSGTWVGTWQNVTPDQSAGGFTLTWKQQGNKLTGTISISGTPCLNGGSITGTVNGAQISFGAVQGQASVDYVGTVAGSTMSGTYSTDCGKARGGWNAKRN